MSIKKLPESRLPVSKAALAFHPRANEALSVVTVRVNNPNCSPFKIEYSDVLPFGRLWYNETNAANNAVSYAQHFSRSHDAVIRVYDAAGNMIETQEHKGDFRECSYE